MKLNIIEIISHAIYVVVVKGDWDLVLIFLMFFRIEMLIQDVFL